MADLYEVGYGKPPKSGQFASGRSGNPKGRPKGSKNIATLFNQITRELINVTENGKTKTMTRVEAVLHQMTNRALTGDPRTMKEFIQLSRHFEEVEKNEPGIMEPSERDAVVMASILKRMGRVGQVSQEVQDPQHEEQTEPEDVTNETDEEEYA